MNTTPKLKQFIEQVAQKQLFDLYQFGAYLRLDLDGERLIIENLGARRISIAYQLWRFSEWLTDPEIVVWIQYDLAAEKEPDGRWVPVELNQIQDGWHACAGFDPEGNMIAFFRHEWQAWLADFTETIVVPNLVSQGWLENGIKSDEPPPSYTIEEMRERGYLIVADLDLNDQEAHDDVPF
jgi:hypothetical protein